MRTPTADGRFPSLPDESLNLVYNACDVGINTAAAEACGLVGLEHAAAGAPQIMPALGACQEMWGGAALLVPAARQGTPPGEWFEYHATAPADLAAAMERLYRDRELLAQSSWDCYTRATQAGWSWDSVAGQWRELLRT